MVTVLLKRTRLGYEITSVVYNVEASRTFGIDFSRTIMLTSASVGLIGAFYTKSWLFGFLAGAGSGALFGLLLAFLHERYKVNQFIMGISLVILGSGLSDLLYKLAFGELLSAPTAPPVRIFPWWSPKPILPISPQDAALWPSVSPFLPVDGRGGLSWEGFFLPP